MAHFDQVVDRRETGSLKWDRYGDDVIPLWVADMDFASPPEVVDALLARSRHGVFGYTIPYDEVVEAVLAYLLTRHGIESRREDLFWLPGLVPALNLACRAYAEPGQGVMTAIPVYPPFRSAPPYSGRVLEAVSLGYREGEWTFDLEAMERTVTPETRVFILCNPHNPVGRVYRREELELVLDFCERHDLVLISDEIHCDLLLDPDAEHIPMLQFGERAAARTVTLLSPSKTYNLPGLACAYAVIPNSTLRSQFVRTARGLITEVNAFGYTGCAAAYRHGEPWRLALIDYLRANRDLLYAFVDTYLPQVRMSPMAATYLAWMDVSGLELDQAAAHFARHGVGLSNGADFGTPGYLRLNFGCRRALLQEGLERMVKALG